MKSFSDIPIKTLLYIGLGMVLIVLFHLGGAFSHLVGQFSPVIGAFIGGSVTIFCACNPMRRSERTEAWIGVEQLSWLLIGGGIIMWAFGDSCWRYFVSIGQSPFPSIADAGYSAFPVFAFVGLLFLPRSGARTKRLVLLMDSLIAMGSLLALSWYLLLGALAQAPGEASLGKFLGLYYPAADTALISCVIFLLLRGQGRTYQSTARRVSLLLVGLGLCFFVTSDFLFNVQNNAGTYVEATWVDLGWPLGMMTIGVAAYVRRFLPATPEHVIQERMQQGLDETGFRPQQLVPYGLLILLFLALSLDVLSNTPAQQALRPVLLIATLSVVGLVIARQVFTIWENSRLTKQQTEALEDLAQANKQVEEQSRQITQHSMQLEHGIEHLKDVQAKIANGNLAARAQLSSGVLLPLAGSLNLMAERLSRLGQNNAYAQRLFKALGELSVAFERATRGSSLVIPESCKNLAEIERLLVALQVQRVPASQQLQQERQRTPLPTPHPTTRALSSAQDGSVKQSDHSGRPVYLNTTAPQHMHAAEEQNQQATFGANSSDRPFISWREQHRVEEKRA